VLNEARADVRLSKLFTDNMMVQRDRPIRIWGLAEPEESVKVVLGGGGEASPPSTGSAGSPQASSGQCKADQDGRWAVELPARKEGENLTMTVAGRNTVTLKNVIVGDIWLCGGQSNMSFPLKTSLGAADDIRGADLPKIRCIKIDAAPSVFPEVNAPATTPWRVCSPQTAEGFTAVGFYFAREVYAKTKVPIGLLDANRSGTAIEPWIPFEGMLQVHKPATEALRYSINRHVGSELPADLTVTEAWLAAARAALDKGVLVNADVAPPPAVPNISAKGLDELARWLASAREALKCGQLVTAEGVRLPPPPVVALVNSKESPLPVQPTIKGPPNGGSGWLGCGASCFLYNGMIHPLRRLPLKGMLWYQGESNAMQKDGDLRYGLKSNVLVESWRNAWGQGDFPFYYVQLPGWPWPGGKFDEGPAGGDGWAVVRNAQLKSLVIPNSGMAVTLDVGDADLHPLNKCDVGIRLARWALARDYGQKELEVSGPLFREMKIEGNRVKLLFDHAGSGLMIGKKKGRDLVIEDKEGKLKRFAIAAASPAASTNSAVQGVKWVWADAVIEGNAVLVSAPEVTTPVAVRYACSQNPVGANLYNRDGLPASPFRTDE
jgi:sialate O-acetylesterase